MRKIEKTIYNFDELNEDIKNKLIEEEKDKEYQLYLEHSLEDDMTIKASELVKEYFGKASKFDGTYYSLSYCQGDGAMIEFTTYTSVINYLLDGGLTYEEIKTIESYGDTIKVKHNNSCHYYHEKSFTIDYESDYSYFTDENVEELENKIEKLIEKFTDVIIKMNKELTNYGWDMIDRDKYYYDMGYILETLRENEYYEDGGVYYG